MVGRSRGRFAPATSVYSLAPGSRAPRERDYDGQMIGYEPKIPNTSDDSSPYDDYYGPIVPYNPNNGSASGVDDTNQDDTPFFSEEWLGNVFAGKHKFENGSSNWWFS